MALSALVSAVLLAVGGDAAWVNLEDAAWEPGKLRLPVTVVERSGVARGGEVMTGGVPFPPGFLPDVKRLGVVDAAGIPVPCQATVILRSFVASKWLKTSKLLLNTTDTEASGRFVVKKDRERVIEATSAAGRGQPGEEQRREDAQR